MNFDGLYCEYQEAARSLDLDETEGVILASIQRQEMFLMVKGKSVKQWVMSSSKRLPSCFQDSLGTPWGLHEVNEKIGDGEPLGMVFEGRKAIGQIYEDCDPAKKAKNLITTRILRLRGLQAGLNSGAGMDSFERYIYVHGTNHENKLGKPSSSGCLQLSNLDVLELYELVCDGTHLWIENQGLTN